MPTPHDTGKQSPAVIWLATCVTLVAGGVACTFIAVSMNADPLGILKSGGPILALGGVLWWLLRDRKPRNQQALRWSWLKRPQTRKTQLKLSRARGATTPTVPVAGPPTVDSIRELKGGVNTWVPSELRRRPGTSAPGEPPQ